MCVVKECEQSVQSPLALLSEGLVVDCPDVASSQSHFDKPVDRLEKLSAAFEQNGNPARANRSGRAGERVASHGGQGNNIVG
jgi:hypothetical protein